MKSFSSLLPFVFVLMASPQIAHSTLILVVTTKDGYWIGADSYRSRNAGKERIRAVCKIHEITNGLLVKYGSSAGFTQDGRDYSTEKNVEVLMKDHPSYEDFKEATANTYKKQMDDKIRFFCLH